MGRLRRGVGGEGRHQIGGEQARLIERPVYGDGAAGEVDVARQRRFDEAVEVGVVVARPPRVIEAVAGGHGLGGEQIGFEGLRRVRGAGAEAEQQEREKKACDVHHSLESASMGLRREALRAGTKPKTIPMADEQTSASSMDPAE